MRVAFDLHSTVGRATGIGVNARSLWQALSAMELEDIEFLPLGLDGPGATPGTLGRLWWEQLRLPRLIAASDVDLVHLTGFGVPWWRRKPVVLTVHDLIGMRVPVKGIGAGLYWGHILPATVAWADAIVADSEATRRDCSELLGLDPKRITVIPCGVDPRFQPPTPKERVEFQDRLSIDKPYLLAVASLEPRKNLPMLVDAFADVLAQGKFGGDLQLFLAGKAAGDEAGIREAIRRRGVEDRVRLLGWVSDGDLPLFYGCCRAFVYPSSYEGFGLPVLEALACGAPTLTTRVSSLPEVGGKLACYVEAPPSTDRLVEAIVELLKDEQLPMRMVEDGPRWARRFSWEASARRLVEVYRSFAR